MNNGFVKKDKGFTIIEVVLVLAIAGLIFLIVFLALPQLQRSRRDTQRRSDTGRILAALESYAGNNNGTYPNDDAAGWSAFATQYLPTAEYSDPSNGPYGIGTGGTAIAFTGTAPGATPGDLIFMAGRICGAGGVLTGTGAGARDVAVAMRLEQGVFCQDNR